jgi:hypothetical protein
MRDPETVRRLLERDLIEHSDDADLRLIWADLLQLEGDPLGTLVILDHVGQSPGVPAAVAERARVEAEALRQQLRARLWEQAIPDEPAFTLIWRQGFVRELQLRPDWVWSRSSTMIDKLSKTIVLLLRQPALRWVEVVRIEVDDELADSWSQWFPRTRLHNPILREIHVGRPAQLRVRPGGAWERLESPVGWGTLDHAVIAGLQQLRHVSIGGERIRLACRDGNSQTRLHHVASLATRALTSQNRASLARALWDESVLVHRAAFEVATSLGPRAEFLIDELAWFLRPPLSKKDPRPLAALQALTAVGSASASLLGEVLAQPQELLNGPRIIAFMNWLIVLGPAAAPAQSLLDAILNGHHGVVTPAVRQAIKQVRRAVDSH